MMHQGGTRYRKNRKIESSRLYSECLEDRDLPSWKCLTLQSQLKLHLKKSCKTHPMLPTNQSTNQSTYRTNRIPNQSKPNQPTISNDLSLITYINHLKSNHIQDQNVQFLVTIQKIESDMTFQERPTPSAPSHGSAPSSVNGRPTPGAPAPRDTRAMGNGSCCLAQYLGRPEWSKIKTFLFFVCCRICCQIYNFMMWFDAMFTFFFERLYWLFRLISKLWMSDLFPRRMESKMGLPKVRIEVEDVTCCDKSCPSIPPNDSVLSTLWKLQVCGSTRMNKSFDKNWNTSIS